MTQTVLEIPVDLSPPTAASAPGRRGSGPSQLARLATDGRAVMGTSHRQKPVKQPGR